MLLVGRRKIAKHLDLSWNTVRKLYYDEGLPLVSLGSQWALDLDMLQDWLTNKSQRQKCQNMKINKQVEVNL